MEVYSQLKFLRFRDRLDAVAAGNVPAPVHVRIKPINRCNHDCWYCAYRNSNLKLGEDMDEDDTIPTPKLLEIADDIVAMGVKAVTFSGGGEPLLHKALPETITRLAAGGVAVATLTNGVNLQGRVGDALARHATWVRISIDAWDNDSYRKSRSARPGDFDRVMNNMRAFKASGTKCVLGVSLIIDQANHTHIADLAARFKDLGADHVKLAGAVTANSAAEHNAYHERFAAETMRQIESAQKLADSGFQVLNHVHRMAESFAKPYHSCPFARFLTVIGADQTVYLCQDKAYTKDGALGSIRERRFADFWFSDENKKALDSIDPSRHCQHHCVAHGKNLALMDYLSQDLDHTVFV
jgi:sulfatase maturation enzyme AslB (radical SAM superfamily)